MKRFAVPLLRRRGLGGLPCARLARPRAMQLRGLEQSRRHMWSNFDLMSEDPKGAKAPQEDKGTSSSGSGEPPEDDDKEKQQKGSDKKQKRKVENYSVVVTPKIFFDVSTLPLRMLVHRTAIWFVNFMVPSLELNWTDFSRGAEQAVWAVHSHLAAGDLDQLRGLVTKQLLQDLKKEGTPHDATGEDWSEPPRLLHVNVVALFGSRAAPPNEDTEASALVLTPLIKVHEEYNYKGSDEPRRTIRLLKWEFEQRIPTGGMPTDWTGDGWQICNLEQRWFLQKM